MFVLLSGFLITVCSQLVINLPADFTRMVVEKLKLSVAGAVRPHMAFDLIKSLQQGKEIKVTRSFFKIQNAQKHQNKLEITSSMHWLPIEK